MRLLLLHESPRAVYRAAIDSDVPSTSNMMSKISAFREANILTEPQSLNWEEIRHSNGRWDSNYGFRPTADSGWHPLWLDDIYTAHHSLKSLVSFQQPKIL